MSFKRPFCCLTVPRQLRAHMDPLWISDDILNDALSRFTLFKSSRRHGSSIPGPLEARRRATKRRVMNLVSPPAGGVIDPGFFDPDFLPCINPGLNSTGRQWQASSRPASQEPVAQVEDGIHILSQSKKQMLIQKRSNTSTTLAYRHPAN